jgi:serine/threonine protein kinase
MDSWIGRRINSPYVIKVIEPARPKTCLYYLTEFVNGTTLTQWMRENPRPAVQEAVFLIEQIGKGIRAFHKRETIHQDLQPDNIMIHADGRVKIIDFGACQVVGTAAPANCELTSPSTAYSAPEYSTRQQPNYRADLFSLAVISYQMLTAQLPFNGELASCKSQKDFLATKYTEAFKINPLVPHWIDGALKKGLRFQQERRHADIPEFVYELQHPNAKYLEYHHRPLMARDPLLAWKVLAGVLAFTQMATLVLLFGS